MAFKNGGRFFSLLFFISISISSEMIFLGIKKNRSLVIYLVTNRKK